MQRSCKYPPPPQKKTSRNEPPQTHSNVKKPSQTLLEQRHRLGILLLQIPVPDPMHPRLQPLANLDQIAPNALGQHANQPPGLPRRLDDALAPRPPHLIVRRERVGDGLGVADAPEHGLEHERVFDGLAGALALEGRRGVRGVAHHGDVADGVGRGGEVVAHGPDGEGGAVQEGDEAAGFFAPAGEEGVELGVGGGHDPLLAFPAGALKVHDDDVEDLAEVDGVAEDGLAWEIGSVLSVGDLGGLGKSAYLARRGTLNSARIRRLASPPPCPLG